MRMFENDHSLDNLPEWIHIDANAGQTHSNGRLGEMRRATSQDAKEVRGLLQTQHAQHYWWGRCLTHQADKNSFVSPMRSMYKRLPPLVGIPDTNTARLLSDGLGGAVSRRG